MPVLLLSEVARHDGGEGGGIDVLAEGGAAPLGLEHGRTLAQSDSKGGSQLQGPGTPRGDRAVSQTSHRRAGFMWRPVPGAP